MSDRSLELACASLTIMESLLLELKEKGILSSEEVTALFEDARDAHRNVNRTDYSQLHENIAKTIGVLGNGIDTTNICRDLDRLDQDETD